MMNHTQRSFAQPNELSTEEMRAQLPSNCIGTDIRLSWALYSLSFKHTNNEAISAIYELSVRYGTGAMLEHFLLLPERIYQWIIRGLEETLENHAEASPEGMLRGGVNYLPLDCSFGLATYDLAPKRWATQFLRDVVQKRPIVSDNEPHSK